MKQVPVFGDQDMRRMLRRCGNGGLGPRNRCMMMLSWLGGMRVSEITALTVDNVLGPDGKIREEIQVQCVRRLRDELPRHPQGQGHRP